MQDICSRLIFFDKFDYLVSYFVGGGASRENKTERIGYEFGREIHPSPKTLVKSECVKNNIKVSK